MGLLRQSGWHHATAKDLVLSDPAKVLEYAQREAANAQALATFS
jgi:hypothetical protein